MKKYYENTEGQLFVDPIVANHVGLTQITQDQFNQIIAERNTPTPEQALENQRLQLKAERDTSLRDITHTLEDGSVVQVRPSDLGTLNLAIAAGETEDWVLADDTVRTLTVPEMQEALLSGIEQGKVIWRVYTEELKQL